MNGISRYVIQGFPFCRMCAGVNRLKRPDRHLRIDLRGLHAGMTPHRLYPPQICTILQHLCRHRVPEQVAAPVPNQAGGFHIVAAEAGEVPATVYP